RLSGVEEVTSAHEMLHAAYDRLSTKERNRVDELLQNYYDHQLTDQRIRATIDAYKASEPNDLQNEMHSIFGTEIATLPPELENYYSQYFADRSKVTTLAGEYEQEFTSRKTEIQSYDTQLDGLRAQI